MLHISCIFPKRVLIASYDTSPRGGRRHSMCISHSIHNINPHHPVFNFACLSNQHLISRAGTLWRAGLSPRKSLMYLGTNTEVHYIKAPGTIPCLIISERLIMAHTISVQLSCQPASFSSRCQLVLNRAIPPSAETQLVEYLAHITWKRSVDGTRWRGIWHGNSISKILKGGFT